MTMNTFRSRSSAIKNFSKAQVYLKQKPIRNTLSNRYAQTYMWKWVPECK